MSTVDLIYDADCPNADGARAQLRAAFAAVGSAPAWREWERSGAATPAEMRGYGSPTILVDGEDVAPAPALDGTGGCRLYLDGDAGGRVPNLGVIVAALGRSARRAGSPRSRSHAVPVVAALPGVVVALLPVLACPACWPAYAGLLSALGLGFLMSTAYLLPITAILLAAAVAALGYAARRRRGYGPLALGAAGAGIVLAGKFAFGVGAAGYVGAAALIAASLWSSWPRRKAGGAAPCACDAEPSLPS